MKKKKLIKRRKTGKSILDKWITEALNSTLFDDLDCGYTFTMKNKIIGKYELIDKREKKDDTRYKQIDHEF